MATAADRMEPIRRSFLRSRSDGLRRSDPPVDDKKPDEKPPETSGSDGA